MTFAHCWGPSIYNIDRLNKLVIVALFPLVSQHSLIRAPSTHTHSPIFTDSSLYLPDESSVRAIRPALLPTLTSSDG